MSLLFAFNSFVVRNPGERHLAKGIFYRMNNQHGITMKQSTFLLSFLALALSTNAQYTECVTDNVVFHRNGTTITRASILLPIPQTNQYQTVHNTALNGGKRCKTDGSGDRYARFQINNLTEDSIVVGVRTVITHNVITTDFSQIDPNLEYDVTSEEYLLYTGATIEGYVDPNNPTIIQIADSIWSVSEGIVNYAYNCYNHVAANYGYLNPNTGIHTLSQILADGGGDCGNLSSIFISLLRHKGVPARHVVSIFSNGDCHVWAEFKMEGYGWIPVDVTYHQSDANGDYFGRYNYNATIVGFDVGHTYSRWNANDTYTTGILQDYHWWWWGYGGEPTSQWRISGEETEPSGIAMADINKMNVYQLDGNIVIKLDGNADKQTVSVFDMAGRPVIIGKKMHGDKIVVPVPASGVYLVTVDGSRTHKVVVLK